VSAEGFDFTALDEVIHVRTRLGIMAYLIGAGAADFVTLKRDLRLSDGNLSVHLRKLEEAGYVSVERVIKGKQTRTTATLTRSGRKAFAGYVAEVSRLAALTGRGVD
jgi:DNA-binding MarR family transcriptional regulator